MRVRMDVLYYYTALKLVSFGFPLAIGFFVPTISTRIFV